MGLRRLGVTIGSLLAFAAVVLAVLPFRRAISMDEAGGLVAHCRSPAVAAWNRDPKGQLALWAVTTEAGSGHEIRSGEEPWCAETARRRLVIAGGLLSVGIGLVVIGRRTSKSSA